MPSIDWDKPCHVCSCCGGGVDRMSVSSNMELWYVVEMVTLLWLCNTGENYGFVESYRQTRFLLVLRLTGILHNFITSIKTY